MVDSKLVIFPTEQYAAENAPRFVPGADGIMQTPARKTSKVRR